ncbi:MAG: cytochrome d ubiquinol oxidase subunit II [Rikenellaceae bacterium]
MDKYIFLQHYWWFLISLLAGLLVFLLFVQGGQTLIYGFGKNSKDKEQIISAIGLKWEFTFTTLVTFGGAFFASFPLFYSTSFGGAIYVWMAILFCFIIQAVSYEFRKKPSNFLGDKTYELFLFINGFLGTILLGCAVGTLFTGGEFIVDRASFTNITTANVISVWQNELRGLEAVLDYRNVALGLAVYFLSRVLAIHYFYNSIDSASIVEKSKKPLFVSSVAFLVFFLTFFVSLLFSKGVEYNPATGSSTWVDYKYLTNLLEMPIIALFLAAGVVSVLIALWLGITKQSPKAIWYSGVGTVVTVTSLILLAGYNNTAYYPSLSEVNSSLAIANSSSSEFTLNVMAFASLGLPFVLAYICYTWKKLKL